MNELFVYVIRYRKANNEYQTRVFAPNIDEASRAFRVKEGEGAFIKSIEKRRTDIFKSAVVVETLKADDSYNSRCL